jgi:acetate---CoA ligase (ADP-forming)
LPALSKGFKEADKFLEMAKLAAERGKPIVLIKIGRSELGARAARSHTAALRGQTLGTMRSLPNTG